MKKNTQRSFISLLVSIALCLGICTLTASANTEATRDTWDASLQGEAAWAMAGANPERTSYTTEQINNPVQPIWYKPFAAYIPQRVQIIAAGGRLYVSTAKGLYALNANTGAEEWVFPTELPLGHSPTIYQSVVYVGGLDHNLYAINAQTGQLLWSFAANAGFETNPLVLGDKVYLGNRDGFFYAVYINGSNAGRLAWRYEVGAPILYSASYTNGMVIFGANNNHAYALDAETGAVRWVSNQFSGAGFRAWWPVIYQNQVVFSGSNNYRGIAPGPDISLNKLESGDPSLFARNAARGTLPGELVVATAQNAPEWPAGTVLVDATAILNYFQNKPWRRSVIVLSTNNGQESAVAPVLWAGTQSGNRYPPALGADGVLYQQNVYLSDPNAMAGGQVAGWKPGSKYISIVSSDWGAGDEPQAYAIGGNILEWNLCCDRESGSINLNIPNTVFYDRYRANIRPATEGLPNAREWYHYIYNLSQLAPNYNESYYMGDAYNAYGKSYGTYGNHGDTNPPIPYQGRLYMHRSNAVIAFGTNPNGSAPVKLATAQIKPVSNATQTQQGEAAISSAMQQQVHQMVTAGNLRTAYANHGYFNQFAGYVCGDNLVDYFSQTSDTLYSLLRTRTHLSGTEQQQLDNLIQQEFTRFSSANFKNHRGWQGTAREFAPLPIEVENALSTYTPPDYNYFFASSGGVNNTKIWALNPFTYYVLAEYAATFGDAQQILNQLYGLNAFPAVPETPADSVLLAMPHVHNAFIAGYTGYLKLLQLAGQPDNPVYRQQLNHLLTLRSDNFRIDVSQSNASYAYCNTLNIASNFMYLTPELASYLRQHNLEQVRQAVDSYTQIAPFWFVTFSSDSILENSVNTLYDANAIFTAKAWILNESASKLESYLDTPAFKVGDLFYLTRASVLLDSYATGPSYQVYLPMIIR
jgi:outer membrane protein assembly factor BamB